MANPRLADPLRLFLDASVLFSAAYSASGGSRELLTATTLIPKRILLVSEFVLTETKRNLRAKAPGHVATFEQLIETINPTLLAEPTLRQVLAAYQVVVWKDAPVVAGAVRGKCDYLVTLDRKDLLSEADAIEQTFGLRVATPGDLLQILRES